MRLVLKILIPVLVLCAGVGVAYYLITFKPVPEVNVYVPKDPPVRVQPATLKTVSIPVFTRGAISPSTQTQLSLEVAGAVKKVSPKLANGAFFNKGDVLLEVDDQRYRFELSQARSKLAVAQEMYDRVKDELEIDRNTENLPPDLILPKGTANRKLKESRAQVNSAKTTVDLAKSQIEKTKLKAPFDGRVLKAAVGLGQILAPGAPVAQVYSVDVAEVRLPLTDRLLGLVDVPELYLGRPENEVKPGPSVAMQMSFGGQNYYWEGEIIRSEGGLDPLNRLLYLVAEIKDPFERDPNQPGRPPLTQGRFLEAQIEGVVRDNIAVLPREVVRYGNQVWVVDKSERIHKREVEVLHKGKDVVYVVSGIKEGDLVVTTPLEIAVEGMKVSVVGEDDVDQSNTNIVSIDDSPGNEPPEFRPTKEPGVNQEPSPVNNTSNDAQQNYSRAVEEAVTQATAEVASKDYVLNDKARKALAAVESSSRSFTASEKKRVADQVEKLRQRIEGSTVENQVVLESSAAKQEAQGAIQNEAQTPNESAIATVEAPAQIESETVVQSQQPAQVKKQEPDEKGRQQVPTPSPGAIVNVVGGGGNTVVSKATLPKPLKEPVQ